MIKRKFAIVGVAALLMSGLSLNTFADDTTMVKENNVKIEVEGNSSIGGGDGDGNGVAGLNLSIADAIDFKGTEISSTVSTHKTGFENDFEVKDLRGSFDGWELTVNASQLGIKDGGDLSTGVLSLGDVSVEGAENTIAPSKVLNERKVIDKGEVRVVQAEEGEGAGVFDVNFGDEALELVLDPAEARTGVYESTLTWNLKSTPSAD